MKTVFWVSLCVIAYTYAGYPLCIALLARLRPRPWLRAAWPLDELQPAPPVSILMAVHNGEAMVASQVDHLLELDQRLVKEVLIVSDGSTDRTGEILHAVAASHGDPRLRIIVNERQGGKVAALNRAIGEATGEILLFLDIRPRVEEGALASLLSNFADPRVGCVAGELLLHSERHDATTSAVSGVYWKYEQWIRNCEAAVDSPVGVYGGFYAVRRALAVKAPAGLILDDMFQPLSIIRQGYRSVVDREAKVMDRWPEKAAGEFSRKVRTLAGNFQLIQQAPWVLALSNRVWFQLVSHKLLRLVVPYCFVMLAVSSGLLGLHAMGFALFAGVQVAGWILGAVSINYRVPGLQRLGAPVSALLLLNAAAVAGLWTFLFTRGPLWKIWVATPCEAQERPLA